MYTLVQRKGNERLHELFYKTPCGRTHKMASVLDKGTRDERVIFSNEIVTGNTIRELMKLLEA